MRFDYGKVPNATHIQIIYSNVHVYSCLHPYWPHVVDELYTWIQLLLIGVRNVKPFDAWRLRNCSHQQLSVNLIAAVPSELQDVWTWNAVVGCGFGHVWSHGTCDTPWFAVNHHGLHSAFHADASLRGFIYGKRVKSLVETHRRRSKSVQFLQAILYLFHGLCTT